MVIVCLRLYLGVLYLCNGVVVESIGFILLPIIDRLLRLSPCDCALELSLTADSIKKTYILKKGKINVKFNAYKFTKKRKRKSCRK
jgi:hypothetical protein